MVDRPSVGETRIIYTPWHRRVASNLVDFAGLAILAGAFREHGEPTAFVVCLVIAWAWGLFNALLAGLNGQSVGKRLVGAVLVDGDSFDLIGGRRAILRMVAHIADTFPMGIGFLAPIFSRERRCFADIIMNTVVVMKDSAQAT